VTLDDFTIVMDNFTCNITARKTLSFINGPISLNVSATNNSITSNVLQITIVSVAQPGDVINVQYTGDTTQFPTNGGIVYNGYSSIDNPHIVLHANTKYTNPLIYKPTLMAGQVDDITQDAV
jgi:hypothetical protein